MIFGKKIKELREERGLLQRQLSAALEIDTPMYWLADKVLDTVEDASEVKNDAIAYVQNEIENG